MNIQGPNLAAGIAGTGRAQARGGDTENQQVVASSTMRAASPTGTSGDDQISTIDPSGKTDDRGGDGHEHYQSQHAPSDQDATEEQEGRKRPSIDGSGEQLDLEA